MRDEQKLPETWEEYQQARRVAFYKGAMYRTRLPERIGGYSHGDHINAARDVYPIRRKVPREAVDSMGIKYRRHQGLQFTAIEYYFRPAREWRTVSTTTLVVSEELVRLWADLLARPYDEVDE